jgi:Na+/H+ antiporter NhaD/arsenite permease-like protein
LAKLGFLNWIGGLVEETILSVPIDYRLSAALLLILWVSGICSAIIDNIPFTTMMIPVITNLGKNPDVQVTFRVLVFNVFSFKLLLKTLCRGRNYKRFHHVFPTQSNG